MPARTHHATRYIQPVFSHCSESADFGRGLSDALAGLQGGVHYVGDGFSGIAAKPHLDCIELAEGESLIEMPPFFASLDEATGMSESNQIRALEQPDLPGAVNYEDTIASLDRAVAEEVLASRLRESWAADQKDQAQSHGQSCINNDGEGFASGAQYMSRGNADQVFVSLSGGVGDAWARQQSSLRDGYQSDDSNFWRPRRYL